MPLLWSCNEHGLRKPRFKRKGSAAAYCDLCSKLNGITAGLYKGGKAKARERARVWYENNREKKIAYERAKRMAQVI